MLAKQSYPIVTNIDSDVYVVFNTHNAKPSGQTRISLQHQKLGSKWQYKSSMPEAITGTCGSSAVSADHSVYVVGGSNRLCSQYNTITDTWASLTQPGYEHNFGSAVMYQGRIYLCGGSSYSTEVKEYNVTSNAWKTCSFKMPLGLQNHCVVMFRKP